MLSFTGCPVYITKTPQSWESARSETKGVRCVVRTRCSASVPDQQKVCEQRQTNRAATNKGWFYDKFVKDQTLEAKLAALREASAANKGLVNTWFEDSFQYTAWFEVHRALTERRLPSVDSAEALKMTESMFNKAVMIDVREAQDYEEVHAAMALSAPLFRLIQGNDLRANARRFGYALLASFSGTERNPEFERAVEAATKGNKSRPLLVICGRGGTLETVVERKGPKAKKFKDPERMFGIASRSLKACYELQEMGYKKVIHVKGGLNQWSFEDFPLGGKSA